MSQIFAVIYLNGPTALASTRLAFQIVATDFAYGCFVPIVVRRLHVFKCGLPDLE